MRIWYYKSLFYSFHFSLRIGFHFIGLSGQRIYYEGRFSSLIFSYYSPINVSESTVYFVEGQGLKNPYLDPWSNLRHDLRHSSQVLSIAACKITYPDQRYK